MNAMESKNSSKESEESGAEQPDSGIQSLSEMSGGFDAAAAAERARMKKEELSAESTEDAEPDIESETSEVTPTDDSETAEAEDETFDAERAVDGKKFEGFFTPDEEKAIYVSALEADVAKYKRILDERKQSLANMQAVKPKFWQFSRKKDLQESIEYLNSHIEGYTRDLDMAQKSLDEAGSLSPEEISRKLSRLVEGDLKQAKREVYENERNKYYVADGDSFGSYMSESVARREADRAPLLERTRWKDYGFMRGESGDDGSTPGRLYKTKEEE